MKKISNMRILTVVGLLIWMLSMPLIVGAVSYEQGVDLAIERKKYWIRRILFGGFIGVLLQKTSSFCETRYVAKRLFQRVVSLPFYIGVHEAMLEEEKSVDKVRSLSKHSNDTN